MKHFCVMMSVLCLVCAPSWAQEKEPVKPDVDWVLVESTGTISSAKQGAMEKTIWQGQKRTDIEFLLSRLPNQPQLRSVLELQRNLLLSTTDSSLIENDIGPLRGNDLLIQRIRKLMAMGLYDDAWELYTQKAENPYDVSIAQLGMLLLVIRNDLATACLEEKVFSAQYPSDKFFVILDKACSQTLGVTTSPQFEESKVLQNVYNDRTFSVFAKSFEELMKMNDLERALVLANGKIQYDGLTAEILSKTPSMLVALYAMDKSMADSARALVLNEVDNRGLSWHTQALAKSPLLKRAMDLSKDPEDQWPVLLEAMNTIKTPSDLLPFASMIASSKPPEGNLSTETIIKVLSGLLATKTPLSSFWLKQAQEKIKEKPIINIYLAAFSSLTPTKEIEVNKDELFTSLKALKAADRDQILGIIDKLDKKAENLDNPILIYEKEKLLTLQNNYVMPNAGLNMLFDTALEKKQIGITVLTILITLATHPDNMYFGTVAESLDGMLSVGLLEDAKQIGAEVIASVLNKYN